MKIKNLIRSYSFWTALAGALCILVSALGRAFSFKVEEKIISDVVMAIAGVLVAIGVVNLPKKDDSQEADAQEETSNEEDETSNDGNEKEGE